MKKTLILTVIFLAGAAILATPILKAETVVKGIAKISGTAPDSKISGTATFIQTDKGLEVELQLANVPPGEHAFHVHQFGSCDDTGKAAGGHYNPLNVPHGFLPKDGMEHAHMGDMGNLTIAENGSGSLKISLPGLTLEGGKYNVAGRAVIVHEKVDDFGQPTGNAGGRIACGIIGVTEE